MKKLLFILALLFGTFSYAQDSLKIKHPTTKVVLKRIKKDSLTTALDSLRKVHKVDCFIVEPINNVGEKKVLENIGV